MKSIPVLLSIFMLSSVSAWGGDSTDARRIVREAYKRSDVACARKDSRTLLSFLAPDYKGTFSGNTVTKVGMSRNMRLLFSVGKTIKVKTTIRKLTYQGGKVTVLGQEYASLQGVNPRTRKPAHWVMDSTFQDVWSKTGSRWLKQSTMTLRIKSTLNGKPIPLKPNPKRSASATT